jgi:hypothetical protein
MRGLFSIVGLLLALLMVLFLVKKQLTATGAPIALPQAPGAAATLPSGVGATPAQQAEQYKQAVDALMQQKRPEPDEK